MNRVRVFRCFTIMTGSLFAKWTPIKKLKPTVFRVSEHYFSTAKPLASSSAQLNLTGVYPPITTAFDETGSIIYEKLALNIEKWKTIPFRGLVVLGSTGEFVSLTEEERLKVVTFVKQAVSSEKLIIAGSGCESTHGTIELTNKMADAGVHAALIVSPFFYKGRLNEDALYDHYTKVADSSNVPIILYSVPANTSIDLSPSLVVKLADHPNIIGLKDSGGDITKIGLILHKTQGKEFQVLAGSAGFFYPALCIGCVGGVLALANPLGAPLCELHQLYLTGKFEDARRLQLRLIGPNLAVTKLFGISGVKSAMDMLGYYGGFTRSPLKQLTASEETQLRNVFTENGFL